MGELETALPHFERALQLSPRDPNQHWFYNGLGTCHMNLGNFDLAIDSFLKARSGNPRIYEFSLWLAATHGLRGDIPEAKDALAAFHELQPEVTSLAKLRDFAPRLFRRRRNQQTWVGGLRLAGLPDE
jgi:tetratricopeptide (TPR) repeat protein